MDPLMIGIIGLIVLFILLFAKMPIGLAMAFVGFTGWWYLAGLNGALHQLGTVPFSSVAKFTLSVLPLFLLMGEWAHISGLTEGVYDTAYKILGRLPGGLAISTIGACSVFAACTGSSFAGAATMVKVALPSMRKYKYDDTLSLASIAAGGTLGILIPPSSPMIVYAIITGTSIGKLFIAGFIPGILLAAMFMVTIYFICKIRPEMGPAGERASLSEMLAAFKNIWPGILLSVIVLIGLWGGVFSPSEAGGFGAFIALLIVLLRKGFAIPLIIDGLRGTVKTTAMIFLIIVGTMIFGNFITLSGLPSALVAFISNLPLSPIGILLVIIFIYIILGCILDALAMVLLTLPIIFPVITFLGIDPVFFGILLTVTIQMALITPPIGMVTFIIAGMVRDVPMYRIFRGIIPFVINMAALIVLLIIFPEIALWLPNTMR